MPRAGRDEEALAGALPTGLRTAAVVSGLCRAYEMCATAEQSGARKIPTSLPRFARKQH